MSSELAVDEREHKEEERKVVPGLRAGGYRQQKAGDESRHDLAIFSDPEESEGSQLEDNDFDALVGEFFWFLREKENQKRMTPRSPHSTGVLTPRRTSSRYTPRSSTTTPTRKSPSMRNRIDSPSDDYGVYRARSKLFEQVDKAASAKEAAPLEANENDGDENVPSEIIASFNKESEVDRVAPSFTKEPVSLEANENDGESASKEETQEETDPVLDDRSDESSLPSSDEESEPVSSALDSSNRSDSASSTQDTTAVTDPVLDDRSDESLLSSSDEESISDSSAPESFNIAKSASSSQDSTVVDANDNVIDGTSSGSSFPSDETKSTHDSPEPAKVNITGTLDKKKDFFESSVDSESSPTAKSTSSRDREYEIESEEDASVAEYVETKAFLSVPSFTRETFHSDDESNPNETSYLSEDEDNDLWSIDPFGLSRSEIKTKIESFEPDLESREYENTDTEETVSADLTPVSSVRGDKGSKKNDDQHRKAYSIWTRKGLMGRRPKQAYPRHNADLSSHRRPKQAQSRRKEGLSSSRRPKQALSIKHNGEGLSTRVARVISRSVVLLRCESHADSPFEIEKQEETEGWIHPAMSDVEVSIASTESNRMIAGPQNDFLGDPLALGSAHPYANETTVATNEASSPSDETTIATDEMSSPSETRHEAFDVMNELSSFFPSPPLQKASATASQRNLEPFGLSAVASPEPATPRKAVLIEEPSDTAALSSPRALNGTKRDDAFDTAPLGTVTAEGLHSTFDSLKGVAQTGLKSESEVACDDCIRPVESTEDGRDRQETPSTLPSTIHDPKAACELPPTQPSNSFTILTTESAVDSQQIKLFEVPPSVFADGDATDKLPTMTTVSPQQNAKVLDESDSKSEPVISVYAADRSVPFAKLATEFMAGSEPSEPREASQSVDVSIEEAVKASFAPREDIENAMPTSNAKSTTRAKESRVKFAPFHTEISYDVGSSEFEKPAEMEIARNDEPSRTLRWLASKQKSSKNVEPGMTFDSPLEKETNSTVQVQHAANGTLDQAEQVKGPSASLSDSPNETEAMSKFGALLNAFEIATKKDTIDADYESSVEPVASSALPIRQAGDQEAESCHPQSDKNTNSMNEQISTCEVGATHCMTKDHDMEGSASPTSGIHFGSEPKITFDDTPSAAEDTSDNVHCSFDSLPVESTDDLEQGENLESEIMLPGKVSTQSVVQTANKSSPNRPTIETGDDEASSNVSEQTARDEPATDATTAEGAACFSPKDITIVAVPTVDGSTEQTSATSSLVDSITDPTETSSTSVRDSVEIDSETELAGEDSNKALEASTKEESDTGPATPKSEGHFSLRDFAIVAIATEMTEQTSASSSLALSSTDSVQVFEASDTSATSSVESETGTGLSSISSPSQVGTLDSGLVDAAAVEETHSVEPDLERELTSMLTYVSPFKPAFDEEETSLDEFLNNLLLNKEPSSITYVSPFKPPSDSVEAIRESITGSVTNPQEEPEIDREMRFADVTVEPTCSEERDGPTPRADEQSKATPRNSRFSSILSKWKEKSDHNPNGHFLSPDRDKITRTPEKAIKPPSRVWTAPSKLGSSRVEYDVMSRQKMVPVMLLSERAPKQEASVPFSSPPRYENPTSNEESSVPSQIFMPPITPSNALTVDVNTDKDKQPDSASHRRPPPSPSKIEDIPDVPPQAYTRSSTVTVHNNETDGSVSTVSHDDLCACTDVFSGNDQLVEFFLPKLGMSHSCGKRTTILIDSDPISLAHILRPWQVDFLRSVEIYRGDQLVKECRKRVGSLAGAMRNWRTRQGLTSPKTISCGMALHIWSRTCKYYVRSIRRQMADGLVEVEPPTLAEVMSSFMDKDNGVSVPVERRLSLLTMGGESPKEM